MSRGSGIDLGGGDGRRSGDGCETAFRPRLALARGESPHSFIGKVNKAVAKARAASGRTKFSGSSGRFNARGRGARIAPGLKGHGAWTVEHGMRFRARRVIVKARVVKLAGPGSKAAYAHLRYLQREGAGLERAETPERESSATDLRGRTYAYSAENQLYTGREAGTNVLLAQNVYYADGTRRYLNSAASGVRRFHYDGDQEIAEYDSADATLVRRYIRLPGSVDEPFLMIDYAVNGTCATGPNGAAACERWAHQNRLGSVVAVTSNAGAVIERHQYGPYGEVGGSASGFPFRFAGQKLDPETGLYYYKARFYDPETGRFLQTDPIGYRDQMNLYAYVYNDPVNVTDPNGECPWCIGAAIGVTFQAIREVRSGSFKGGVFTKEGGKALARIGVSGAVGAVTGGVGGAISKSVVGLGVKETAKAIAVNAAKNAAVGSAASTAGQVTANTAEAAIDGGISGAGAAIADGSVLEGAGAAAVNGAVAGAAGSVVGDVITAGVAASPVGGAPGTISPGFTAGAVVGGNAVGNLNSGDLAPTQDQNRCAQRDNCN